MTEPRAAINDQSRRQLTDERWELLRMLDAWLELTVRFLVTTHLIRGTKDQMSRFIVTQFDEAGIGIASATYDIVGLPRSSFEQCPGRSWGRAVLDAWCAGAPHPQVDDMLDDLAEQVLKMGGDVVIAPAERMPSTAGLAAIYRY